MRIRTFLPVFAVALFTVSQALAATWTIDPVHSSVQFGVKHMMVSMARGNFAIFEGKATSTDSTLTDLAVEATIDAASINTNNTRRDDHLRSADFFDAANHPKITFVSKRTERVAPGKLKLIGDLTIRGITKEVTLDVEGFDHFVKDMSGGTRTAATATTKINRQDFGLKWNKALEAGGVVVGDEVTIQLDVALVSGQDS